MRTTCDLNCVYSVLDSVANGFLRVGVCVKNNM